MCDYSLMAFPNRLAISGEELIVHRFEAGALGLASSNDLKETEKSAQVKGLFRTLMTLFAQPTNHSCPAVCIPPGARLLLRDIPAKLCQELGLNNPWAEVSFTQTNITAGFRDAIQFDNGSELLLQRLSEGQRVRVLTLSSEDYRGLLLDRPSFARR
jgi:hypothetical protein